jgi:hypothetical protein
MQRSIMGRSWGLYRPFHVRDHPDVYSIELSVRYDNFYSQILFMHFLFVCGLHAVSSCSGEVASRHELCSQMARLRENHPTLRTAQQSQWRLCGRPFTMRAGDDGQPYRRFP